MKSIARLEVPIIREGQPTKVGALVEVTAPSVEKQNRRPRQQAVVFVIDRSGSMSGKPLDLVKNSINEIIGRLAPTDLVSVISFDTGVIKHVPLVQIGKMSIQGIRRDVSEIQAGGGTNIELGYTIGLQEATKAPSGVESRVILLSDGQANHGLIDPDSFAKTAASATEHLIKTSTIGIGDGYDERILDQMARAGAGNHFAAVEVDEAVTGLNDEIDGLLGRSLEDVHIEVLLPDIDGLEIEALGYTRKLRKTSRGLIANYGELASNETRGFAFVITIPAMSLSRYGSLEFGFKAKAIDVTSGERLRAISLKDLQIVEASRYKVPARDENVAAEVMAFRLAEIKKAAADAAWSGDMNLARKIIRQAQGEVEAIAKHLDKLSPRLKQKIVEERSELAQFIHYREAEFSKRATESSFRSATSKIDPRRS